MKKPSLINLKCPCFLLGYPNLDISSQALFNLHRASALRPKCGSEDDQHFLSPPGHSRRPITWCRYLIIPVKHSAPWYEMLDLFKIWHLTDTRRYGPLRGPTSSSCGGLRPRPRLFLRFGQKKKLLCCFGPFLAIFGVQYYENLKKSQKFTFFQIFFYFWRKKNFAEKKEKKMLSS